MTLSKTLKRIRIRLLLLSISVLMSGVTFAQRVVQGTVISKDDGTPLPGVNIIIPGTTRGSSTDVEGKYKVEAGDADHALSFSFIGYKSQTVDITGKTTVDVVLEMDTEVLDEIVVIGYGSVRKSDLTGAVSSVKGTDLIKIPSSSPIQALQGKVSGVQITSASGAPGSGAVVRIRGVGTFNNSSPIYVLDGVILDNIDFLNSADIQSMEVLKDASATAIYGSRGANGVIIVTTKKGVIGQEYPTISVNDDYSVQQLPKKIDLLNGKQFATIANEIAPGSYNNVDAVPNTDWQDQIFRTAPIHNYQVSVAGASPKIQYYVGVGYFKQEGIIAKSNYERLSIKLNNTYNLSKSVRLGNNLTFTPSQQQNTAGGAVFGVYRAQPVITPFKPDGSYSPVPGVGNVLADIDYTNSFGKGLRTVGNFFAEADFLKNFTFKSSFGVDMEYSKGRSFTPVYFVSTLQQNPINDLNKSFNDRLSWLWENTVSYNRDFGKSRLAAVAGYTTQETSSEYFSAAGQNIIREGQDFWYLNQSNINPNTVSNGVDINQNYSMMSYLFRANYSYNDKYLFTATYRRDGSSKFAKNNRYADFPAIALGWNVINEDFIKDNSVLSDLKLRASWGIIGNEKIAYDRQYSRVNNGVNAVFGSAEAIYPGSTYGVSGNPNLKWESTHQTDVGLEANFFNNKLTTEFDYYQRSTQDILIDLAVPGYLGNGDGAAITFNSAVVLNRGFEYNIGWNGEVGGLKYRLGTVGTTIHNEATKISGFSGSGDFVQNGSGTSRTTVGSPLGSFYGYKVIGVFQNQADLDSYPHRSDAEIGFLKYEDTNKDGVLTSDDRVNIGSPIPTFIYGVSSEFSYQSFDLSVDFQGQQGNKIYNAKETIRPDLYNFEQHVFDRWTGEGTSNVEPKATSGGYNFLPSTRFIQDGSYLRLRSVMIGYNLSKSFAAKLKMKMARIYLRGTNLFTATKFTGYTPEVASSNPLDTGSDFGGYPIPRVFSAGFNMTF